MAEIVDLVNVVLNGPTDGAAWLKLRKTPPFPEATISDEDPVTLTFPDANMASAALGLLLGRTGMGQFDVPKLPPDQK